MYLYIYIYVYNVYLYKQYVDLLIHCRALEFSHCQKNHTMYTYLLWYKAIICIPNFMKNALKNFLLNLTTCS